MKTYPQRLRWRWIINSLVSLLVFLICFDIIPLRPTFNGDLVIGGLSVLGVFGLVIANIVFFCSFRKRIRKALRSSDGTLNLRVCQGCLYDLRGSPSAACPECGLAIPEDLEERWRRIGLLGIARRQPPWVVYLIVWSVSLIGLGLVLVNADHDVVGPAGWWVLGAGVAGTFGSLGLWYCLKRRERHAM